MDQGGADSAAVCGCGLGNGPGAPNNSSQDRLDLLHVRFRVLLVSDGCCAMIEQLGAHNTDG